MNRGGYLRLGVAVGLTLVAAQPPARAHARQPAGLYSAAAAQGRNAINGRVYNPEGQPVGDVYVELLDDLGTTIQRVKADASGRFSFRGLTDGRFKVKVLPYHRDYLERVQEVTLASVSAVAGGGADQQHVDIYLKANERAHASPFGVAPGVLFAQEVPPAARKLYEAGVGHLGEKREKEGFENLRKAIEAFPDYYQALDRLGAEYVVRGPSNRAYMEAGLVLLTKAAEVNPNSFSSLFGRGWALYHLGHHAEAVESLRRANALYNKSPDAQLWLGRALKRVSKLGEAEAAFKRARELTGGKAAEAHWQLAGLYGEQKRYREAADSLELFLKAQPEAADAEKIKALIKQLRAKAAGTENAP